MLNELAADIIWQNENIKQLDVLKNTSLYVGISDNRVTSPENEITKEMTLKIEYYAKNRYSMTFELCDLTLKHLEEMRASMINDPDIKELNDQEIAKFFGLDEIT